MKSSEILAVTSLRRWALERSALRRGAVAHLLPMRGRPTAVNRATLREAALVRCLDFEAAFATLPEDLQGLLVARYVEGLPVHLAAQLAGCSPRTAFSRLEQARAQLADVLDRRDLL